MSQRPISLSPDLKRLRDEGYQVEIRSAHLLVHGIPYVNSHRQIARGILASTLTLAADVTRPPDTHMAYFIGEYPCNADGSEIGQIRHSSGAFRLGDQLTANHWFSSKPTSGGVHRSYSDYYEKMTTYATIISSPASSLDSTVTAKTFAPVPADADDSVFAYLDTASSRAGIGGLSGKLAVGRIAIVGLGGTGSYVLDLVAKTPVKEIHLFDGDRFLQHNAFRSPGAATLDQLRAAPYKVDYLKGIYSAMHKGIAAHAHDIIADNAGELGGMSFAFVCIDGGARKRAIVEKLEQAAIPFVDTGLGVELGDDALLGMVRLTTSTPEQRDHFRSKVSLADRDVENLYRRNIQIADLNALNAALAVIKWKKLVGFYQDLDHEHDATYVISGNRLLNDVKP
jgi:hypothetical protein